MVVYSQQFHHVKLEYILDRNC